MTIKMNHLNLHRVVCRSIEHTLRQSHGAESGWYTSILASVRLLTRLEWYVWYEFTWEPPSVRKPCKSCICLFTSSTNRIGPWAVWPAYASWRHLKRGRESWWHVYCLEPISAITKAFCSRVLLECCYRAITVIIVCSGIKPLEFFECIPYTKFQGRGVECGWLWVGALNKAVSPRCKQYN